MSKRQASVQLTKDDPDLDDEAPTEEGTWQRADDATLKKRVFRKVKRPDRRSEASSLPLPPSNPFASVVLEASSSAESTSFAGIHSAPPATAANPSAGIQLAPPSTASDPFVSIQLEAPAQAQLAPAHVIGRRTLGSGTAALEVSAQGLGCMGITAFYGKRMEDERAVALLRHAFDRGVTHWDTAEVYTCEAADGSLIYNESVVGKAIAAVGQRECLQIATKYLPTHHSADAMSAAMVLTACRESCARLGVPSVDLYYVHRLHPAVPVEQQAKAMLAVREAGLAKRIGVSEFSPRNLRAFHAVCEVTCVQQEWSLMTRDLEADLVPVCRELGIGIVAYSPLCRKLLSAEVHSLADLDEGDLRPMRVCRAL